MKCNIDNTIKAYKYIDKTVHELNKAKKIDEKLLRESINDSWLKQINNPMNGKEAEVYKRLVEQTDGVALVNITDTKQIQEPIVVVKEAGDKFVVHLDSGKNYAFKKDSKVSEPTSSGRTVTMNAMENVSKSLAHRVEKNGVLYNEEESADIKITEKHKKLEEDLWKDAGKMNDLFDILEENDGGETKHSKSLRELMTTIVGSTKPILNEFKVYMDDKADRNGGTATLYGAKESKIVLNMNNSDMVDGEMTAAEAYVHEILHLSVEAAKDYKSNQLQPVMSELTKLWDQAGKEITPEMLQVGTGKAAEDKAQRDWDYMFNNKQGNGLSEFIAKGRTNERMQELLGKVKVKNKVRELKSDSIFDHLTHYIVKMYDAIAEMFKNDAKGKMGDERLAWLVSEMWKVNNQTVKDSGLVAKMSRKAGKVKQTINTQLVDKLLKTATVLDDVLMWTADKMPYSTGVILKIPRNMVAQISPWITQDQIKARESVLSEFSEAMEEIGLGGVLAPESFFRSTLRYLNPDDDLRTRVEKFTLFNKQVDAKGQHTVAAIGKDVISKLEGAPKRAQRVLTEIFMEADLKVLVQDYGLGGIKDMLGDVNKVTEAIDKEYAKLDVLVTDKGTANYYKSQARGLGKYLVTGESGATIHKRAEAIVGMVGTGLEREVVDKIESGKYREVVKIVDRLASLNAIGNMDNEQDRQIAVDLIDNNLDAVNAIIGYHTAYEDAMWTYYNEHQSNIVYNKGEIKEIKPAYVTTKVADNSEQTVKHMKKLGYKIKGETAVDGVYLYVSTVDGLAPYEKQALAKINANKKLHNINQVTGLMVRLGKDGLVTGSQEKFVESIQKEAAEEIARQMKSVVEPKVNGFSMELNSAGEITGYGVTSNKHMYVDAVRQDLSAPKLIGSMIAEADEKVAATELNKEVMRTMWADMAQNYRRGGDKMDNNWQEYIEIGPDAVHVNDRAAEYAKELWEGMPANAKRDIYQRGDGKQYIAIRRDLATMYIGYRSPSVLDLKLPVGLAEEGGIKTKSIQKLLDDHGMEVVAQVIKLAGEVWTEIVRAQKIYIVIKTPIVLVENIISAFNYSVAMGQWPWEVLGQQFAMLKATREYTKLQEREIVLETKLKNRAGTDRETVKKLMIELGAVKEKKKVNTVHDLMEAGLRITMAEGMGEMDLHSRGRIEQFTEKYTDKIPEVIKTAFAGLYVTSDTGLFKAVETATIDMDFVFRAQRYYYLRSEKGGKLSKNRATKQVLDEATNYNRADSKLIKWANDMAPLFTKFFLGSNKNLLARLKEDPLAVLTMTMLLDVPNPAEASFINKNYGYWQNSMFSPVDNALQLSDPALLKALGLID